MIYRHSVNILCLILIVSLTVRNVSAISLEDIFEYFLDAVDDGDSDELSDELVNSNLNVTCKNCNVSVVCHNCTHSQRETQSTLPIQTSTQNNQEITSSSPLSAPTIPAPDRTADNIPSESITTATQSASTTVTVPLPSPAITNSSPDDASTQTVSARPDDGNQATDDGSNVTTSADSNTSDDGVTGETDSTTAST